MAEESILFYSVSQERRRRSQMLASLRKSVSVRAHASLLEQRSQRLVVTDDAECATCRKRLGSAGFASLPSGEMVHIGDCLVGR